MRRRRMLDPARPRVSFARLLLFLLTIRYADSTAAAAAAAKGREHLREQTVHLLLVLGELLEEGLNIVVLERHLGFA